MSSASEMAQLVKVNTIRTDNLTFISGIPMGKRENQLLKISVFCLYVAASLPTHSNSINNVKLCIRVTLENHSAQIYLYIYLEMACLPLCLFQDKTIKKIQLTICKYHNLEVGSR